MTVNVTSSEKISIPRSIWTLGFVSLFMDMSSELVHALLPIFLVSTLGLSATALGMIEGVAEATALIVKIFSGAISDYLGRRKGLILFGYGLAALTKPLFPLATVPAVAITARLLDRLGKGIRGAPRDAFVADVAPPAIRGACFGLRQSMDTVGAFLGPLLAIGLMFHFSDHIRTVLWFSVIPAIIAIALIAFGLGETGHTPARRTFRSPLHWRSLREFSARYWWYVGIGASVMLARFSEAFLVLRAQQAGLELAWIPGVMVVMSLVYSVSAYPVGKLSDRLNHRVLLGMGLTFLIVADLLLGLGHSMLLLFVGVAVWGLHMGFTQGVVTALIAEAAPPTLRGTAFGVFNLACGLCMIVGSTLAGWLWDRFGSPTTFVAGAALAVVPLVLCLLAPRQTPSSA
ncbi:MFS transporter [Burkholderia sp. SRS-W-2-2016]|uniref:MFS transporter n=1 Tax=Burkholderia sp. SRS-W-2-2016 TaxID=1926878 RepID=UPI00094AF1BF|nr:MFS transporter [Burkholderia sp. SRS-W-2-2016]OLL27253.1 MFS transporter [Burkholderia sp. SRS-W-2-2016]